MKRIELTDLPLAPDTELRPQPRGGICDGQTFTRSQVMIDAGAILGVWDDTDIPHV